MKSYNSIYFIIALFLSIVACKPKTTVPKETNTSMQYAKGFVYKKYPKHTKITVLRPFKGSTNPFEYILITGDTIIKSNGPNQVIVQTPINKIIATSTTQIPVLEALNSENLLKGFPNTNFISSKKTRTLIDNKNIIDIGHEEHMNTEMVLDIKPDILFAFAVNNLNKNFTTLKKAGIPIVIDASWLEETPLGRVEWLKFFALFLNKEKEANVIFNDIEKNYKTALNTVPKNTEKPSILYGNIYNDVWYTPAGESYIAQIMKDAKTNYLWKNTTGTGSLSLQFEDVFLKGKNADFWFSPGFALTKKALSQKNKHYSQFSPYKKDNVYTYSNTTGATGGLLFFELGALRPDYILKDFIKICHPETLPNYEPTFFKKLK